MDDSFERAKALFFEGNGHFEAGRFDAAQASFEASLALLPGRASTLANLGAARIRLGRSEAALNALEQALAIDPADLDAWSHKGLALADLGRHAEALECHDNVLSVDPERAPNRLQRGLALAALQRHAEALQAYDGVVELEPGHAPAWFRRGQALQFLERHDEALASYDQALVLDPTLGEAWSHRGGILRDAKRLDEAAHAYEQALANGADAELNRYFLASVTGRAAPQTAPAAYVEPLFDDYAPSFEQHVVGALNYQAHAALVRDLRALDAGRRYASALDLGCGTGLCGPRVRPLVERLEGVDLSARMLDRARAVGAYDSLVHADALEHLGAADARYDLVLSADVFIYIGDLDPLFGAVRRALRPGGIFCYTVELAGADADFVLLPSLRYAHAERYLAGLAARHGFETLRSVHGPIREDQREPVAGLYVYLKKTS